MEDLELVDNKYYYKNIFTGIYKDHLEDGDMQYRLLMKKIKNTIDAFLNDTLFEYIMNSKFGDFNVMLDVLINIDYNDIYINDSVKYESIKIIRNDSEDIIEFYIGELVVRCNSRLDYGFIEFSLHDKSFTYIECDICWNCIYCENEDCNYTISHKLTSVMTKSARN